MYFSRMIAMHNEHPAGVTESNKVWFLLTDHVLTRGVHENVSAVRPDNHLVLFQVAG